MSLLTLNLNPMAVKITLDSELLGQQKVSDDTLPISHFITIPTRQNNTRKLTCLVAKSSMYHWLVIRWTKSINGCLPPVMIRQFVLKSGVSILKTKRIVSGIIWKLWWMGSRVRSIAENLKLLQCVHRNTSGILRFYFMIFWTKNEQNFWYFIVSHLWII